MLRVFILLCLATALKVCVCSGENVKKNVTWDSDHPLLHKVLCGAALPPLRGVSCRGASCRGHSACWHISGALDQHLIGLTFFHQFPSFPVWLQWERHGEEEWNRKAESVMSFWGLLNSGGISNSVDSVMTKIEKDLGNFIFLAQIFIWLMTGKQAEVLWVQTTQHINTEKCIFTYIDYVVF